jgi:hypothetical protein
MSSSVEEVDTVRFFVPAHYTHMCNVSSISSISAYNGCLHPTQGESEFVDRETKAQSCVGHSNVVLLKNVEHKLFVRVSCTKYKYVILVECKVQTTARVSSKGR